MRIAQNDNSNNNTARVIISIAVVVLISIAYIIQLFKIQIVNGDMYYAKGKESSVRTLDVSAQRGEILDRNGIPLIVNRMGYSIILDAAYFPSSKNPDERNSVIYSLVKILEDEGEAWSGHLPITMDADGVLKFSDNSDIKRLKSFLNLNSYATEQNCLDALVKKYKVSDEYSQADALKIVSVRYGMDIGDFSVSLPFTIAEDVSDKTVLRVKENNSVLTGVDVEVKSYREYKDGTLAPHILGSLGPISATEYSDKKDEGYLLNDYIGKSGIEGSMESYLRGTRGKKTVTTDYEGKVETEYTELPKQGNTVVLTIDSGLQRVAQEALEENINSLASQYAANKKNYGPAHAGAVCVVDVKTGDVLAMASYPTYDVEAYSQDMTLYDGVADSPLWNRATKSAYAPGSTFKPCVAIAALTEDIISRSTTITCRREYKFFSDITYTCLGYHGSTNVVRALTVSCNIFFYETGRQLGIGNLEKYASLLGLGEKTNIEIDETAGTLSGPESYDGTWTDGLTVQAAIGQANNAYTPLQLAVYTATVANGGTRYESHLVQSILDSESGETTVKKEPVVLSEAGFSDADVATIHQGMVSAATNGSTSSVFSGLPVSVAVKTGTPQTGVGVANGCLITFAPAEDPEIAIAIVVEEAGSGSGTASIARSIYDYYFSGESSQDTVQQYNTLLP